MSHNSDLLDDIAYVSLFVELVESLVEVVIVAGTTVISERLA